MGETHGVSDCPPLTVGRPSGRAGALAATAGPCGSVLNTTAVSAWPTLPAQWAWLGRCSPRRLGTEAGGVSSGTGRTAWPHGGSKERPGACTVLHFGLEQPLSLAPKADHQRSWSTPRLAAGVLRGRGVLSAGVCHAVCPEGQSKGFKQSFVQNTESNL